MEYRLLETQMQPVSDSCANENNELDYLIETETSAGTLSRAQDSALFREDRKSTSILVIIICLLCGVLGFQYFDYHLSNKVVPQQPAVLVQPVSLDNPNHIHFPLLNYPDHFISHSLYGRWSNRYYEMVGAAKLALALNRTVILIDYDDYGDTVSMDEVLDLNSWNVEYDQKYYSLYGHYRNSTGLKFPQILITFRQFIQFIYPQLFDQTTNDGNDDAPLQIHPTQEGFYKYLCLTWKTPQVEKYNTSSHREGIVNGICHGDNFSKCTLFTHPCMPAKVPFFIPKSQFQALPLTLPSLRKDIEPYRISVFEGSVMFAANGHLPLSANVTSEIGSETFYPNFSPPIWKAAKQVIQHIQDNHNKRRNFRNGNIEQFNSEQQAGRNSSKILCMHIRLGDLKQFMNLTDHLANALAFTKAQSISSNNIFISSNANESEKSQIFQTFPLANFECDSKIIDLCKSGVHALVVNQAVCSLADHFIRSDHSTFSGLVTTIQNSHSLFVKATRSALHMV